MLPTTKHAYIIPIPHPIVKHFCKLKYNLFKNCKLKLKSKTKNNKTN